MLIKRILNGLLEYSEIVELSLVSVYSKAMILLQFAC